MDIQHPPSKALNEFGAENAHVTGENHQIRVVSIDGVGQCGVKRRTVVRKHVLRNSLGPISTISALLIAGLLVSSAVVETAFGLNGIGSLLVQSVDKLDFPIVQAIVLLVVAVFVIINAIVDLLQPLIDPRTAAGVSAR